ncbi:MAG: hypothetical protein V3W19_06720 [Desulfatiglandales bacterium]
MNIAYTPKAQQPVYSHKKKIDSFIFYFAGHGQGLTLEAGEKFGYIIPHDADITLYGY